MDLKDNFESLPHEIYTKTLMEVVQKKFNKSHEDYVVTCTNGSSKGDNYLGVIYRVHVSDKKDNKVVLKLIAKLPPQNSARRSQFLIRECFIREVTFYDTIYPMYKSFQHEKGINVELDGFHHIPHCYKSLTESEPFEGLFLEDLNGNGFEMYDRLKDVTREHVLLAMKALAKLHAICFCIKEQKPELIESYRNIKDYFITQFEREDAPIKTWFESMKLQSLDIISKIGTDKIVKRVHSVLAENIEDLYRNCLNSDDAEPYAILCHGDVSHLIYYSYHQNVTCLFSTVLE